VGLQCPLDRGGQRPQRFDLVLQLFGTGTLGCSGRDGVSALADSLAEPAFERLQRGAGLGCLFGQAIFQGSCLLAGAINFLIEPLFGGTEVEGRLFGCSFDGERCSPSGSSATSPQ